MPGASVQPADDSREDAHERGPGKVINITTVLAHKGFARASLYGAMKAALTLLNYLRVSTITGILRVVFV